MINRSSSRTFNNNMEVLPVSSAGFPLVCNEADMSSFGSSSFPWHWHSALEISFINRGKVEYQTTDKTICLNTGDAVFVNSGIMHSFRQMSEEVCSLQTLIFDRSFLAGISGGLIETSCIYPIIQCADLPMLRIASEDYQSICMLQKILIIIDLMDREPPAFELRVRSELSEFWCLLLEKTEEVRRKSNPRSNADMERMKRMIDFIQQNYAERISLEEIAAAAGISSRECTRCFTRCISNTPVNYLNDYRVRMAAQQLALTDSSIMEIGENCGFSSNSYFGKVFHELMGCTPSEFRRGRKNRPRWQSPLAH